MYCALVDFLRLFVVLGFSGFYFDCVYACVYLLLWCRLFCLLGFVCFCLFWCGFVWFCVVFRLCVGFVLFCIVLFYCTFFWGGFVLFCLNGVFSWVLSSFVLLVGWFDLFGFM